MTTATQSPLWNREENRLRAGPRLIAFLLLNFITLQVLAGSLGVLLLAATGRQPTTALTPDTGAVDVRMISAIVVCLSAMVSLWIGGRFLDRRPIVDFGLLLSSRWLGGWLLGVLSGAVAIAVLFLVQLALGWVEVTEINFFGWSPSFVFFAPIVFFGLAALGEDLMFWGYLLKNLSEGFSFVGSSSTLPSILALAFISTYFSLGHVLNPEATLISTVNIFIAGIMLALGYLLTGQLAITIGLHFSWNFSQGYVFGFPVSGLDPTGPTLLTIRQRGPEILTGGQFGPEGGVLGLCCILLVCVLIYAASWRMGHTGLSPSLSTYRSSLTSSRNSGNATGDRRKQ